MRSDSLHTDGNMDQGECRRRPPRRDGGDGDCPRKGEEARRENTLGRRRTRAQDRLQVAQLTSQHSLTPRHTEHPTPPKELLLGAPWRGALATPPLPYPTLPPPPLGPRRHALPAPRAASILHHEKAMKSATDTVGGNFKFLMPLDETERAVSVSESRYQ